MKLNKYWLKGYKAGKKKLSRKDNPYSLTEEIIKLLRKRTFWDMGYEEGFYSNHKPEKKEHKKRRKHK